MNLESKVKLGQSTNLINGYKGDIYSLPFTNSSKPALHEKGIIVKYPDYDAKWSWPTITLHDNTEDLLSGVLQVKLRQSCLREGKSSAIWPAGALVLAGLTAPARETALTNLSSQLGIDLSRDDRSYALVRRTRYVGKATHLCYERGMFGNPDPDNTLMPDALAALKSLEKLGKKSTDVSMHGANGYLKFYEHYGSHFVSSVQAGDSIFQVFAFATTDYQNIVQIYADRPGDLTGPTASSFALFTTPRNESGYGRTAGIGSICIASEDPEMARSLNDGLWLDDKYAGTHSIFAPFLRSDAVNVNTTFKKITAVSVELASLGVFAEYYRMLIWRRVFKAAMYAKYAEGSGVAPYFGNDCPYDLDSVYKDFSPIGDDGLLSTLATPTVNIWQEKINLSKIELQFPELVGAFSVFSFGIQIPVPSKTKAAIIDVPGSSNVTLLGHVFSSGDTGPIPPNLRLADSAFKEIENRLFCGEFDGGLRISSSTNTKGCVIVNGLMFKEREGIVSVVRDVRATPSMNVLTEQKTNVQFSLVAAEARLNFLLENTASKGQSLELMKRFLLWLAGVAGSHNQYKDEQLAALQARAMYLATVAANDLGAGVPVPYLRYDAYRDVVNNVQNVLQTASDKLTDFQNQIRERKVEEGQVGRIKALNTNIINSGKLLRNYIGTQARYQESMTEMFSTIAKDKADEMEKAIKKAEKLSKSLTEQRTVVDDAIIAYEDAVADWQRRETIKAAIDIASNLFALGFTFFTPASAITALESLGETVQKIQKAVLVFDAVIKVYRNFQAFPSDLQKVVGILKDIGPNGLELPSSLEWDEMKVNFDATLATGPNVGAKVSLSAAFSVLVLRGKALLQSQNAIQAIAADLSAAQQRLKIHKDQKNRLKDLKTTLKSKPENLDTAKIDLVGLSGQLKFFERQMLMILASTLVIQDRALQYEYLRPPTPIGSFTMLNLQLAMLNQSQNINQGLIVQPVPQTQEHPVIYEIHGVKPESITNNQRFTFNISPNKREFSSYNYVRVESVEVEIGGITSTKSGKYYTELVFDGNPFYDRNFDGKVVSFQTASRIFTGLHDVSSSSHMVSDQPNVVEKPEAFLATTGQDPFSGKVSRITPFSTWQVSLPKSPSNEDIAFDDSPRGVTVRLIFHIYAQLKEPSGFASARHHTCRRLLERGNFVRTSKLQAAGVLSFEPSPSLQLLGSCASLQLASAAVPSVYAEEVTSSTTVAVNDVLRMMSGKSVCAGWDVVFSMTAEQVNEQLLAQYTNRKGNPTFVRETGDIVKERKTSTGKIFKTVINFTFDAPRLQFLLNNSNSAQVFLPIKSGLYKLLKYEENHWELEDEDEVKETDRSYIQGDVPLAIIPGSLSTQHNVAIKLNGGAFSAKNFEAGVSNPTVAFALTEYFTNLKDGYEVYNLGTLDFADIKVLKSLTPTDFKLNIYHTPSNRDLLQLFIATTGQLQSATSLYLQEPIPSPYESSLIINSKILFEDVLSTSLGDGGIGLVLKSCRPADDGNRDKVWSSKATAGSVSAPFPETWVSSSSRPIKGGFTSHSESYVKVDNDKAVVNLSGMIFESGDVTSGWDTKMMYNLDSARYTFKYGQRTKLSSWISRGEWSKISYRDYELGVKIDMASNLPLTVSGSGQNQVVGFAATQANVNLSGNLDPPGACKCNDRELQKKFLENLRKTVPPKLVEVFNQPFNSVSLFALKNLLFPAKNLINMAEAYVPGDLVVFGNFTPAEQQ